MDRSVDSIGSCSLDVDAESTDFSDTSGSLNLATPSSGKDIPREFTARIKERCQITTQTQINYNCYQQQTSAILDPNSGKISTIVSPLCVVESPISSPVKKPSYLNLACCVNGYSNLTTYDSKLRQNINKSREVSPIRPSSNNSQQQSHRLSGNYLAVPLTNYGGSKSASSSPSAKGGTAMENRHSFTQVHSVDTTDNVGSGIYFKSAKFISNATLKGDIHENETSKNTKSFIQQRVERLYGPGALAQGFYSPKKTKSQEISVLSERTANSQMKYSTSKTVTTFERDITSSSTTVNGKTTITNSTNLERTSASHETSSENWENMQNGSGGICDLPVLRHLRPEFRAQLPIMSPKRSPNKYAINETSSCPVLQNGNSTLHINGTSNGNANLNLNGESYANDKQTSGSEITVHFVASAEKPKKPPSQINGTVNNNNIDNSIFTSEIIVPDPSCALTIDKSLTDTKVILEKHTQENSECDKVTAVENETSTAITAEKTSEPVANVMTLEAEKTPSDSCVVHDIPEKSLGHILPLNNISQTEQYSAENSSTDRMVLRDGNYFLQILKTEQERLLILANETEKELEALVAASASSSSTAVISDDIFGYLRSASGKARLLVSQKMKQFEGLCKNNLNPLPDERFPTTNEDLQGFWDMVMLQVAHVDSLFHEIAMLRANNWQKPVQQVPSAPQGSKLTRRPNATRSSTAAARTSTAAASTSTASTSSTGAAKKSSASSLAAQRREAQRKQLMEIKRKNKIAMSSTSGGEQQPSENQVVEIFVNEQSNS